MLKMVSKIYENMSLFKKLIIIYIIAIAIPIVYFSIYSYNKTLNSIERDYINEARESAASIKSALLYKINTTEDIMERLSMDPQLNRLLSSKYILMSELLESYKYQIIPQLKNTIIFNKANICRISIYTNNVNLTESWDYFYKLSRISNSKWYNDFMKSSENYMWLGSHQIELFARSKNPDETEVFSFIKKLYSIDHQYMGIMVLDIKVSDMFNELTNLYNNNYYFYILDNSNKVLFPYNAVLPAIIKQNALGNKGYDIRGDTLYVYDTVNPIGVKIISVFNMLTNESIKDNLQKARINMLLTIGISILSMLLLLYLSLKFIFKEINYMLGMMQGVAQGNFNIRIPIEYDDEIGKMAYNFNILIDKINALMKSMLKKESDKRNAEFAALQYQMNPHFIYNAIDIINSKLELDGNYDGAEAIAIFGKILRYNMNNDYKYIPIKDEVENVKNYIELQKIKYGDKVSLNVNLPSDLADHKVIKFIIQPLVENSIKHGFSNSKSSININVDFHIIDCNLEITVRDDGVGISDKRLNEINDVLASNIEEDEHLLNNTRQNGSIGLKNISDRIKLFYGPQYSVRLYSQEGQYTKTIITIPFHTQLK